ncbi:MAG: hypothetical protein BGO29_03435 [Bacteroidales bacterium 36-12]|nr:MAG: hypothetical protein BGO29_03435 [Bacteroidales bacterium 36-12]
MKKGLVFLGFTLLLLIHGCSKEKERGHIGLVFISDVIIPASVSVDEVALIHVAAYAPNGCWSNIRINLNKQQENHYKITATGFFNGQLVCPDILIGADTTFHLTFDAPGKYYFQSNDNPFEIKYDTIEVVY